MKPWYEKLFENYAIKYDKESFAQGTIGECDLIEKELNYNRSLKILDVGCGTGRHAIELTKRGDTVTGVDLSEAQLKAAQSKAAAEGLAIEFLQCDARNLPFNNRFDAAIMLCEGAFPLMETDEMNYEILKSAAKSLKSPGVLIFTTLNGLFPLTHSLNSFYQKENNSEGAQYQSEGFDPMTMRDCNVTTFTDDDGKSFSVDSNERYYIPSEITWMLKSLGFWQIDIFGAKLGAFSRDDRLMTDDFEMLVIAKK